MKLKTALQLGTLATIGLAICVSLGILFASWRQTDFENWTTSLSLAVAMGILALLMAGALYVVGVRLTDRIRRLEEAAHIVSKGDLDHTVALQGKDELATVSEVFNEMVVNLKNYVALITAHEQLREESDKLRETVETLRAHEIEVSDTLERLRRAQEQLVQFDRVQVAVRTLKSISHELLGSLDKIQRLAEQVSASGVGGGSASVLDPAAVAEASKSIRQAMGRFSDLLDSSAHRGAVPLNLRAVVEEAVKEASQRWKDVLRKRNLAVRMVNELDPNLPMIRGIRDDLVLMLEHLIDNAVEAMPQGGTITFRAVRRSPDMLTLSVSDTGTGMPPAVCERCFAPFFSTKEGAGGLGLTVVEGIVVQHKGKVGIESHLGLGTTVFVELPMADANSHLEEEPISASPVRQFNVLVVEDDPWTRGTLAADLKADGHQVQIAANGQEALDKLKANRFDVLITDRAMPAMTGDELAAEVKRLYPDLPIVLLTGFGSFMHAHGEKPKNVDAVLGKPINAGELRTALNRVVR